MQYEQLTLFPLSENNKLKNDLQNEKQIDPISWKMAEEFEIQDLPFLGCDFDVVYRKIGKIIPKERVTFEEFKLDNAILCETICAGICHQINWDYLRKQIYNKTKITPQWLTPDNLLVITEEDVFNILSTYKKKERIRAKERRDIIRSIGEWVKKNNGIRNVFFDNDKLILDYGTIHNNICSCEVFSKDPQEKKLQLLIQKLSTFEQMKELSKFYHPAVDYHLIRNYLRRGLIYPRTKYAEKYIKNNFIERQEKTVAAVRMHCSRMLNEISLYTGLDVSEINLIEWHIGRSVCTQEKADCKLKSENAQWLKPVFSKCPFYNTCLARCGNQEYLKIQEPKYSGISY